MTAQNDAARAVARLNRRARKMTQLEILETSGVAHPAHLHEGWLVMKSASPAAASTLFGTPPAPAKESGTMTVTEQINKKAEELVANKVAGTLAQAIARVIELNPELYAAYRAELDATQAEEPAPAAVLPITGIPTSKAAEPKPSAEQEIMDKATKLFEDGAVPTRELGVARVMSRFPALADRYVTESQGGDEE